MKNEEKLNGNRGRKILFFSGRFKSFDEDGVFTFSFHKGMVTVTNCVYTVR